MATTIAVGYFFPSAAVHSSYSGIGNGTFGFEGSVGEI